MAASSPVSVQQRPSAARAAGEPALTLDGAPPPRSLGLLDQVAFWANLGVSLLGPITALYLLQPANGGQYPIWGAFAALCIGSLVGSFLVALAAVPGTDTGAPAMMLLRGLLGGRLSYLPTGLNILQCVGWAVFELVVISQAAARLVHGGRPGAPTWPWVLGAGVLTVAMAIRPIGSVRVLRRIALVAVIAASTWLLVQLLRHPIAAGAVHGTTGGIHPFLSGIDVMIALSVSWVPLAADYTRHSRDRKATVAGTLVGFGFAQIASVGLGLLAFVTVVNPAVSDPQSALFGSFIAVPLGWLAFGVLVIRELDQSFANVYSTTASTQNMLPRVDRRVIAVTIGLLATGLALIIPIGQYQNFLLLIGAVFVPLLAVLVVDYFLLGGRHHWDLGESAPTRGWLLVPWALGVSAYQLVTPTAIGAWPAWLHGGLSGGLFGLHGAWAVLTTSASATSFLVTALAMLGIARLPHFRGSRSVV